MRDTKDKDAVLSRRDFLGRCGKVGVSVAGGGMLAWALYDAKGPRPASPAGPLVVLPDFSVPGRDPQISIVTGSDRVKTLERALKTLGGIEAFVGPHDRVLIKVNAAFATPPFLSATTNPELLAAMIHLCLKAGAKSVAVTDNPINDAAGCFALTGIGEAARSAGARVMMPRKSLFRPTSVKGGVLIKDWPLLYEPFEGVNKLIGMAPVKDHHRSGASMVMKNWYGLLGGRRNIFHQDIHNIIKELGMLVSPTLVVLDGTTTMVSNGPTGGAMEDLKQTNTMIVATDQVAADAVGATLLGKTAADLPYLAKAAAKGVGTTDYEALKPLRDHVG